MYTYENSTDYKHLELGLNNLEQVMSISMNLSEEMVMYTASSRGMTMPFLTSIRQSKLAKTA